MGNLAQNLSLFILGDFSRRSIVATSFSIDSFSCNISRWVAGGGPAGSWAFPATVCEVVEVVFTAGGWFPWNPDSIDVCGQADAGVGCSTGGVSKVSGSPNDTSEAEPVSEETRDCWDSYNEKACGFSHWSLFGCEREEILGLATLKGLVSHQN